VNAKHSTTGVGSPARLWREPYFSAKGGSASG